MSLRSEYALGHSEYNDFLYAVVGETSSGQELTVLSALARLGLDPWSEAARLSELPKDAAAISLASALGALPREDWTSQADKKSTALRLVDCLPRHSASVDTPPKDSGLRAAKNVRQSGTSKFLILAGLVIATFCAILWLYSDKASGFEKSSIWLNPTPQAYAAAIGADRQRPAGLRDARLVEAGQQRQAERPPETDRTLAVNDLARARVRLGGHLLARGRG